MKRVHPDKKVLTRGEFFNESLDRKYNTGGFKSVVKLLRVEFLLNIKRLRTFVLNLFF